MSLSSHLRDTQSPIGRFLMTHFANTPAITHDPNVQLRSATCLQPTLIPREYYPWGTIGHAIDFRVRLNFTTAVVSLAPALGAEDLLAFVSPAPSTSPQAGRDRRGEFFKHLYGLLNSEAQRVQSTQHAILSIPDEDRLCRFCYVLGLLEETFRSGQPSERLFQFAHKWLSRPQDQPPSGFEQQQFADELLALVEPAWVNDLRQMSNLFLTRSQHLFDKPFILNPTFAGSGFVGGADADLIVDGCLIDLKSSKRASLDPVDLRQLVGYILLDFDDEHAIRSVAIYKARYGLFFTWPLEVYLACLMGQNHVSLSDLRAEFHALCQQSKRQMRSSE